MVRQLDFALMLKVLYKRGHTLLEYRNSNELVDED